MVGFDKLGINNYSTIIREQIPKEIDDEFTTQAYIIGNQSNSIIFIKESFTRNEAIRILSHELIHLEQYRSGKIKRVGKRGVEWDGKLIEDINTIPYKDREWEKEAFSKGRELEKQIRKELIQY